MPASVHSAIKTTPSVSHENTSLLETSVCKTNPEYGTVCLCSFSPLLTTRSMQWISTLSIVVLSLVHATGIRKQLLAPIFALQAPNRLVSWIKGDYGMLTAFMALLVRLFFPIPDELDLLLVAFLLVAVIPYEIMQFRGTRKAAVLSLVVAGYLAFQYFSRIGSL